MTWDIVKLPTKSFGGNVLTGLPEKTSEILGKIKWKSAANTLLGGNNVTPSGFLSLTSNTFSTGAQNVLNKFGNSIGGNFGNIANSMGASTVSNMLGQQLGNDEAGDGKKYMVSLTSQQNSEDSVTFNVMPSIGEQRDANYEELNIAQHPGAILKYQGTGNRSWSLSGIKLISRTKGEASENQRIINILRSWLMPYYGDGTYASQMGGKDMLGAPPDVLNFSAYGDKTIGKISVVMISLNITWPNDVDYISTSTGEPFPVILNVDISLKEAWSPKEYTGFDLYAYKKGDLTNAYIPTRSSSSGSQSAASANTTPINGNKVTNESLMQDNLKNIFSDPNAIQAVVTQEKNVNVKTESGSWKTIGNTGAYIYEQQLAKFKNK